ncbi:MAG TPA: hypothetical protein PKH39_09560 [Woeseiaceae bacterium]|nr:hypothetical protein [Woeseiaceae bacterium]
MIDAHSDLPDDIAREKRVSRRLTEEYRNAIFGGIRKFRALRQQAPGIIAQFVLAVAFSVISVPLLFRNIQFGGVLKDLGYTVKMIAVVVACFWITGRLWRLIGLANRNRIRYVVTNMWSLALGGLLIASVVVKFLFPDFVATP